MECKDLKWPKTQYLVTLYNTDGLARLTAYGQSWWNGPTMLRQIDDEVIAEDKRL